MSAATKTYVNGVVAANLAKHLTGAISGKPVVLPDDASGFPLCQPNVYDSKTGTFTELFKVPLGEKGADVLSHRLKLGLFIPSTNTTMENELWTILKRNEEQAGGVGIHTANVLTAKPALATAEDVANYRRQFMSGLDTALSTVLMAKPQYLIMGMSLEHIINDLPSLHEPMDALEAKAGLGLATWTNAVKAALDKFSAKKIGLVTPFDPTGHQSAIVMFTALGFEVTRSVCFCCATSVDICHVDTESKCRAIREQISCHDDVDAIVQCGTNMSFLPVIETMEAELAEADKSIPVLGINQVLLWYALRECGVDTKFSRAGRLFAEH